MTSLLFITERHYLQYLVVLVRLQFELIDYQQKVIELQEKLNTLIPDNPSDEDVFWHIHSGKLSYETSRTNDAQLLQEFLDWNMEFGEKYLKPYVSPKVYQEATNQMTRGLLERQNELKNRAKLDGDTSGKIIQMQMFDSEDKRAVKQE